MTQPNRPGSLPARQPLASRSLKAVPSISPSPEAGGGGRGGGTGGRGGGRGGGGGGGGAAASVQRAASTLAEGARSRLCRGSRRQPKSNGLRYLPNRSVWLASLRVEAREFPPLVHVPLVLLVGVDPDLRAVVRSHRR